MNSDLFYLFYWNLKWSLNLNFLKKYMQFPPHSSVPIFLILPDKVKSLRVQTIGFIWSFKQICTVVNMLDAFLVCFPCLVITGCPVVCNQGNVKLNSSLKLWLVNLGTISRHWHLTLYHWCRAACQSHWFGKRPQAHKRTEMAIWGLKSVKDASAAKLKE